MGPVEIIGAIKGAVEAAKNVLAVKEVAESAEAKLALADLQLALADAREAAAGLKEENLNLLNEVKRLKSSKNDISQLTRIDGFYVDVAGQKKCTTCIENDKKIISIYPIEKNHKSLKCNVCSGTFPNNDYKPPSVTVGSY